MARKDFYKAMLLQKEDKSWLVDYPSYHKKSRAFNNQGWWLVLLGCMLIPYQLITRPKIKVYVTLGIYLLAFLVYVLLL